MSVQKTFALVLGLVLLLVGILGFINNSLVGNEGYFGTNAYQDILHLIAGAFGVYVGTKGEGRGYNLTLGWVGIALGALGLIPGVDTMLANWLNINFSITILHLVLGVLFLVVAYGTSRE